MHITKIKRTKRKSKAMFLKTIIGILFVVLGFSIMLSSKTFASAPPTFTINDGTDPGPTKDDVINVTVTDNSGDGIATSNYGFSADNMCDGTDTITTAFDSGADFDITGNHTDYLCVAATDNDGNFSYQLIGKLNVDNTPPSLSITSPADGLWVDDNSVISFTDSESTNPKCSSNGISWTNCLSGSTKLSDLTGWGNVPFGLFTLHLKDTDAAGNTGNTSIKLGKSTQATGVTTYGVGGTISGLSGSVVMRNNGGYAITVNANGVFDFETLLNDGDPYSVTVSTQPTGQTCTVTNGSGTISGTISAANVTNVSVTCTNNTYTVGGTVSGLIGTVTLGIDSSLEHTDLPVSSNGSFTFSSRPLGNGSPYLITITTQPTGQTCSVTNGSGTISGANKTNVSVTCSNNPTYTVGGTVSGLSGTVTLSNAANGNEITMADINSNGSFTFGTALINGDTYDVTVVAQPTGQTCTVTNGSGTISSANITNVSVSCSANPTYTVGGTVSGLASGRNVSIINGNDVVATGQNGSFTFPTPLVNGASYSVSIDIQPTNQTCTVSNGSGTISAANVTNVLVSCTTIPTYTVGGTLSGAVAGLGGTTILQNNGGDNLTVSGNGSFTFATQLVSGASYAVTVLAQLSGQTCTVTNGSGTISSANVTNISVSCEDTVTPLPPDNGDTTPGISIPKPKVTVNDNGRSLSSYFMDDKDLELHSTIKSLAGGSVKITKNGNVIATSQIDSNGKWSVKISFSKTTTIKIYYYNSAGTSVGSEKYKIKIDGSSPTFTDLPLVLHKKPGDKLWWTAKDNVGIDHYKYKIDGKTKTIKKTYFFLPAAISKGVHSVDVTAVDKAGNNTTAHVMVWIW